jgi:hypothetical protein
MELVANACIICVTLGIVYVVASKSTTPPAPIKVLRPGEGVELSGVNWQMNNRTLVLFLEEGCVTCEESAAFHKRLVSEAREQEAKVIAVFAKNAPNAIRYARELGLDASEVRSADIRSIGIYRVPSLVLAGASGQAQRLWFGKLTPKQEDDVIRTLRSSLR